MINLSARSRRHNLRLDFLSAALVATVAVSVVFGLVVSLSSRAAAIPGDLNADGTVSVLDLSLLLSSWGKAGVAADLNSNGTVDIFDLSLLLTNWGKTSPTPTAAVSPTPTTTASDFTIMAAGDYDGNTQAGITFALMKAQNPVAILMLGDAEYDGANVGNPATGGFNTQIGSLKSITYPTAGPTHDVQGTMTANYQNYWGRYPYDMYSFNIGNWHIISMPSAALTWNMNLAALQTKLDADLKANTKPCTLAFWHHPYWTLPTGQHPSRDEPGVLPWLQSLYNNNADLILNGTQHNYQRYGPNDPNGRLDTARGIPEFIVGTGGVGFYSFTSSTGSQAPNLLFKNATTYGALKLTLRSNSYDFAFMSDAGVVLDKGTGNCH